MNSMGRMNYWLLLIVTCYLIFKVEAYEPIFEPNNNNIDLFVYRNENDNLENNFSNDINLNSNNVQNPIGDDNDDDENNNQQILALEEAQELSLAALRSARRGQQYLAGSGRDAEGQRAAREAVYILEEKDYPKSLYEHYKGVGQVSGISSLPSGELAVFHRGPVREWNEYTFNSNFSLNASESDNSPPSENLIKEETIMILNGDDGSVVTKLGGNLFYMPHSIASDNLGNLWVSDVARHQVMRLPVGMMHNQEGQWHAPANMSTIWPDIILGEAFVPGADQAHFCQPSEIVVSSDGRLIFVADGYCNQRVMVFLGGSGKFLTSFGDELNMSVVHSLTLMEEKNLICAADRENCRIACFKAGLDGNLIEIGQPLLSLNYPLGKVFAIEALGSENMLVSSNQIGTNKFDVALLNPFSKELKQVWTSTDLLEPHSLAKTKDGLYVYAADISKSAYKKIFKFHVIKRYR